jgi:hypothetical protein
MIMTKNAKARIASIARDVAGLTGAGGIAWGCYEIYPPLGFIVSGAMLLATAIWSAVRGAIYAAARGL